MGNQLDKDDVDKEDKDEVDEEDKEEVDEEDEEDKYDVDEEDKEMDGKKAFFQLSTDAACAPGNVPASTPWPFIALSFISMQ